MHRNLQLCLTHVLEFEGGFSHHPSDPGGATNLGITQAALSRFRGRPVTKAEVRSLTVDEATEIYRRNYWEPCRCDELPDGLDLAVFDCAVNQGVSRASLLLQQAAGLKPLGGIGPRTVAAANAASLEPLLIEFMARRMRAYGLLSNLFRTFGLGWSRRLMATQALALRLSVSPPLEEPSDGSQAVVAAVPVP